jgi:hypothetical protein
MKLTYKVLFSSFAIILFSGILIAQSEVSKEQLELQSALESQLRTQNDVFDPALTEGVGEILLVQDNSLANANLVDSMLNLNSYTVVRILNSQFTAAPAASWLSYGAVIWVGTTSTGAELDSCTSYLAAGGNLIVWENDEAYFFGGNGVPPTPLFANYFQALYFSDEGSDGVITGLDIMDGIVFDISNDPYPDDVTLSGPNSVGTFFAPGDSTFAALRASDGSYRAGLILWDPSSGSFDTNVVVTKKLVDFVAYGIIPVELTSFAASVNGNTVNLNWTTATETNNSGFEVQRKTSNSVWTTIGFVSGFGTTTEVKSYSFTDKDLSVGNYSYRLKQIDYDGTYEIYSVIKVDVNAPAIFSLDQNYPNPFNPSTLIKYSVAQDGFVNVSIFNLLGEKVATLVNSNMKAGSYELSFNASQLSSGVYFYSIEAGDFKAVRKMMLMK